MGGEDKAHNAAADAETKHDPAGPKAPAASKLHELEPRGDANRDAHAIEDDFDEADDLPRLDKPPDALLTAKAQLQESVRMRLRNLEERELEMMQKDKDLERIKQVISGHIDKIATLEDRLQRELGIGKANKDRRSERISALAELIMTMPQQSGAEILANMSDADARDILLAISRKNGRKASKVLAQMPARRAADLSQLYLHSDHQIPGSDGLIPKGQASAGAGK